MHCKKVPRVAKRVLPSSLGGWLNHAGNGGPAVGSVRFGDFARTTPIDVISASAAARRSTDFYRVFRMASGTGLRDRRRNIFATVRGGASDAALHVRADIPHATIVGDLTAAGVLPRASFDCIVFIQPLQFIYDLRTVVASCTRR